MITTVLFPGRHHLLTNFQRDYFRKILNSDLSVCTDADGNPLGLEGKITEIVWAITSANHSNTRRNPLSANRREVAIENFSRELDATSYVYLIDDLGRTDRFAEYVLKKIEVDSLGKLRLTPENTIVGCSTPEVIRLYERLGFRILPFELADRKRVEYVAETPWELIQAIVRAGEGGGGWRQDASFLHRVHPATQELYRKYDYGDLIISLHQDSLLGDEGDITKTRDYNVYARAFDEGADRKYELIKPFVQPGRIVDIGCCTGSLIQRLTRDEKLRESDFYGVEAARRLYTISVRRKEDGEFENENVFFTHRNFLSSKLFPDNSINTAITASLTHEIESYQGRDALEELILRVYAGTAIGGVWINLDVIGPENKDETVCLWLNPEDGKNANWDKLFRSRQDLAGHLQSLSTYARFLRFARDFRRDEGYTTAFKEQKIGGEQILELRMQDACEFLSKKDYTDNWESEMHESFCFWSFSAWKRAIEKAGFVVHRDSRVFTNPWIVKNRYRGKAKIYRMRSNKLQKIPYPPTNMVMVGEKKIAFPDVLYR